MGALVVAIVMAGVPLAVSTQDEGVQEQGVQEQGVQEQDVQERDPQPSGTSTAPSDPKTEEAKRLYLKAEALRKVGAYQRAVPLYQRSRALVVSVANTLNLAVSLTKLGREDSALELYVTLIGPLRHDLTSAELSRITREVERLRAELGAIDIAGDTGASLLVDGRHRGKLPLPGPLPIKPGAHDVRLHKDGYQPWQTVVDTAAGRVTALRVSLKAIGQSKRRTTPRQPRPATPPSGHLWLEAVGGATLAPSLQSSAEKACQSAPCDSDLAAGFMLGARVGYELPFRLSVEVAGGYLSIGKDLRRSAKERYADAAGNQLEVTYDLEHALRVDGGFFAGGLGYRLPIAGPFEMRAHLMLGLAFLNAADTIEGQATVGPSTAPINVVNSGSSQLGINLLIAPEVGFDARFDDTSFGLGLALGYLPLDTSASSVGDIFVDAPCNAAGDVGCTPGETLLRGETVHGPLALLIPNVHLSQRF